MANCHICERLAICPWASPQEIICSSFKRKPITNSDRIRSMTDEELAAAICKIEQMQAKQGHRGFHAWLDWLRQEVSDAL